VNDKLARLDYYTLLGVDAGASTADIKRAFRGFARRYHPDRFAAAAEEKRERATAIYRRGSEAYQVLTDPRARALYDEGLRRGILRLDPAAGDAATRRRAAPAAPARPQGPPIRSTQARLYFEKGVQAAHQGDWRRCWQLLQTALELEPGNDFLQSRLDQVRARLRT